MITSLTSTEIIYKVETFTLLTYPNKHLRRVRRGFLCSLEENFSSVSLRFVRDTVCALLWSVNGERTCSGINFVIFHCSVYYCHLYCMDIFEYEEMLVLFIEYKTKNAPWSKECRFLWELEHIHGLSMIGKTSSRNAAKASLFYI